MAIQAMWAAIGAACLSSGCSGSGGSKGPSPDAGPGDDAAVEPDVPRFDADEGCRGDPGPCLWVDAVPGASAVEVTVTSRGLGDVFGLSAHLVWDDAILSLDDADLDAAQRPVLDPTGDGAAVMIAAARPGDLALGGTRASPAAGTVPLDGEATLARLAFAVAATGSSRLDLTRAVVARHDGALEPVAVAGGALVLPEVAR